MSNLDVISSLNTNPSNSTDSADLRVQSPQGPQGKPTQYFACTDSGNAELMANLYRYVLRYNHATGQWLIWRGHWWAPDSDEGVFRFAKQAMRHRGREAWERTPGGAEWKWARTSESRNRLDAMIKLARGENPISDNGEGWDTHSMLLGVKNGVVDLQTGKLRSGRQADRITTHTDVEFDPSAQCPRWETFLDEVFGGDSEH
jgi:putative DNA primase/helicase